MDVNLQSDIIPSSAPIFPDPVTQNASIWEDFPEQIFRRLFSLLQDSTLNRLRFVCKAWKEEIDTDFGLHVKVDGRIPGNEAFVSKIKVVEARIVNLEVPTENSPPLFAFPDALESLSLYGTVDTLWFKQNILLFKNLTKLVLRGRFLVRAQLYSSDETTSLTTPIPPSLTDNLLLLPNLNTLEILVSEYAYPYYLPLAIRLRDPERVVEFERGFNEMASIVGRNISFVLNKIRSQRMRTLQLFSYQKPGFLLGPVENWRYHPLETFIEYHKETLEELYLPDFEGKHCDEHLERDVPTKIKKLSFLLSGFIGERVEGRIQSSNYWQHFLSSQRGLEAVHLQFMDMPPVWIRDVTTSMFANSKRSLTHVFLAVQMDANLEFDCSILQDCAGLKVFRFLSQETEVLVSNFKFLPAALKKICISSSAVALDGLQEFGKFKGLEMLELATVMVDGDNRDMTLAFIREVLHVRSLNFVGINFSQSVGNHVDIREILDHFSVFWDPRFQYSALSINQSYLIHEGWSDRVFRDSEIDSDFISEQDTEQQPSFGSSSTDVVSRVAVLLHREGFFEDIVHFGARQFQFHNDGDDGDDSAMPSNDSTTPISEDLSDDFL